MKCRCLHADHRSDRCRTGAGRPPVDEAMGRGACGRAGQPPLRGNGVPYAGINVLMLWAAAMERVMPRRSG